MDEVEKQSVKAQERFKDPFVDRKTTAYHNRVARAKEASKDVRKVISGGVGKRSSDAKSTAGKSAPGKAATKDVEMEDGEALDKDDA